MCVRRGIVQCRRGVGAVVTDCVERSEAELSLPSLEGVAFARRRDAVGVERRSVAVAHVAVEVVEVAGGLRKERAHFAVRALKHGRRDRDLIELDVRVVRMQGSEERRGLRDRDRKVHADARGAAADRTARRLGERVRCDARLRQRLFCDLGERHRSGARGIVWILLRGIIRPHIEVPGRAHVAHELQAPRPGMRAVDHRKRDRHRDLVAVRGARSVCFPVRRKAHVLGRCFVVRAVGIRLKLILKSGRPLWPQVDPDGVVAPRDPAADVAAAGYRVVRML